MTRPMLPDTDSYPGTMKTEYCPIGKFHTPCTPGTGAPRQGLLRPGIEGIIEIFEEYSGALRDLDDYEYIIVLYHMHLSGKWHSPVRPPASKRSFGLFATRSPNRPNPIGFAIIKLNRMEGRMLHVSGIDAFDGTPVLDIKPWIPSIDCPPHRSVRDTEKDIGLYRPESGRWESGRWKSSHRSPSAPDPVP